MAGVNGRTKMEKLWMNSIENNYVHIISNLECVKSSAGEIMQARAE